MDVEQLLARTAAADAGAALGGWRDRAACAGMDTELFFGEEGESSGLLGGLTGGSAVMGGESALDVCGRCPVVGECLEYAVETNQPYGIWGGRSEPQRRRLRGSWLQRGSSGQDEDDLLVGFGEGRSVQQFRWDSTGG